MIPKHIIDEHKTAAEGATFYGVPIEQLDREALLSMIGCLSKELRGSRERTLGYIGMFKALNTYHAHVS
jgi:hypothetical protein